MNCVVTFLLANNADAAIGFYRDTLGLRFLGDNGLALVFDMGGVLLRIGKVQEFTPAEHTVLGWESDDIAVAVDELATKGIVFTRYPNMVHDERGICKFPDGYCVAWFKDPAGNVLSLSQPPESAA